MIHHLRARGILVAICSKNDEEVVRSLWERASPYNWLTLDDFVIRKINWQPKAINIAEIMQETSLTAKSVVFVDDNPVEREAVKTAFPEIRVIGDNPFMTRSILLRASETQVAFLSQESSRPETMIRKQIDREKERVGLSREDFLMGLNCKVRLTDVNGDEGPNFRRAFELLNRTNQFNTTGRRWTNSDVRAFFGQGGRMFAFNVVDKFTDYGLVGVIVILDSKIEQFVMSCRILGLEIEKAVLSVVIGMHRDSKVHPLIAKACSTKDNMVCRDLYPSCGFVLHQCEDDIIEYVYDQDSPRIPNHIELICQGDGANSAALAGVSPA
jgi:FkbH-like protein